LGDPEKIAKRIKDYEERFANPFVAAERGFIDDVILPRNDAQAHLARAQHAAQQAGREPLEEARQHSEWLISACARANRMGMCPTTWRSG
jgi:acetyl-CoA carboxylase carboxyltransferase component